MATMTSRDLAVSLLGIGLACVAAFLNVNGESAMILWFGVFLCFIEVV